MVIYNKNVRVLKVAGISDNLEEFRKLSNMHYKYLIEGLDEKYCWKCPMRTNRSESFCREVDSWVRLSGAFEMGVQDALREMGLPNPCMEVLASKILGKKMGFSSEKKLMRLIIFKIKENMGYGVLSGKFVLIKENPTILKSEDIIVLPKACPLATYWYSKMDFSSMPMKLFKVKKVFHKTGLRYVETDDGLKIPLEFVYGLILKIIDENDTISTELRLNEV